MEKKRECCHDSALGWELKSWIHFQVSHHPVKCLIGEKGEDSHGPDSTHLLGSLTCAAVAA